MYPKEDRERILADFHASGMSVSAFARIPGNPVDQTIRSWLRQEDAGELDVPVRRVRGRCEHRKHGRYPEATKREARRLRAKGMGYGDIARRLGVSSRAVVRTWCLPARISPREAVPMDDEAKREIERLRAQHEEDELRIRALMELMRDPKAAGPENLSNRRKVELGEKLRRDFGCSQKSVRTILGISRSTYTYNLRRGASREAREAEVLANVRRAFEESGRTYGYRRVRAAMAAWPEPFLASEREVRRAMREGGMRPRRTRKGGWSSYGGEVDERPANVPLNPDGTHSFSAEAPGRMVVTDVTEFKVGARKVYLSPVIDCFDGLPAAWSASEHPDSALCDSSLEGFLETLPEGHGEVLAHTDGGICYRSASWKRICSENGVVRSMSRKANSGDNARAEGFFGTLKEEFYNGRDWSRATVEGFVAELGEYISWYRDGRLKAFREGGRTVYDTIMGRRRRLGLAD